MILWGSIAKYQFCSYLPHTRYYSYPWCLYSSDFSPIFGTWQRVRREQLLALLHICSFPFSEKQTSDTFILNIHQSVKYQKHLWTKEQAELSPLYVLHGLCLNHINRAKQRRPPNLFVADSYWGKKSFEIHIEKYQF